MCVCLFKLSNMNISATSWPITTTFYLKHHWGGGKGCIRFWTRSDLNSGFYGSRYFHKVIMGKILYHSSAFILIGSSLYLQVPRKTIISWTSSNFSKIQPRTADLAALELLKKFP